MVRIAVIDFDRVSHLCQSALPALVTGGHQRRVYRPIIRNHQVPCGRDKSHERILPHGLFPAEHRGKRCEPLHYLYEKFPVVSRFWLVGHFVEIGRKEPERDGRASLIRGICRHQDERIVAASVPELPPSILERHPGSVEKTLVTQTFHLVLIAFLYHQAVIHVRGNRGGIYAFLIREIIQDIAVCHGFYRSVGKKGPEIPGAEEFHRKRLPYAFVCRPGRAFDIHPDHRFSPGFVHRQCSKS